MRGADDALPLALTAANYSNTECGAVFGIVVGTVAAGAAVGPVLGDLVTTLASYGSLGSSSASDNRNGPTGLGGGQLGPVHSR